MSYTQT